MYTFQKNSVLQSNIYYNNQCSMKIPSFTNKLMIFEQADKQSPIAFKLYLTSQKRRSNKKCQLRTHPPLPSKVPSYRRIIIFDIPLCPIKQLYPPTDFIIYVFPQSKCNSINKSKCKYNVTIYITKEENTRVSQNYFFLKEKILFKRVNFWTAPRGGKTVDKLINFDNFDQCKPFKASRFNLLPLHRKGTGVKQLRKSAKLSSSNNSDILLFWTRIYDIETSTIQFNAVLLQLFS